MKTLVAFYSRADENYFGGSLRYIEMGNTEKIANMLAELTGGTKYKMKQTTPYAKDYKICVEEAKRDHQENARPEICNLPKSIDEYDEIYLGFPNYCGDMPMAVYTFLETFSWEGKTIHPFCTHEGSGMGQIGNRIAEICQGAVVTKGLAIHGSAVDGAKNDVAKWMGQ